MYLVTVRLENNCENSCPEPEGVEEGEPPEDVGEAQYKRRDNDSDEGYLRS